MTGTKNRLRGKAARSGRSAPALLRAGALFCVCAVIFGMLGQPAYAETAAEKYERLKEELGQIDGEIESAKQNKAAAEEEKAAFVQQKQVVDEMIALKQQEIADTEARLAAKENDIAEKRQVIYENDQLFQQRLTAIYKMNTSTELSRLLNVDSFSGLMQVMDALQRISKNDTDLLNLLEQQRRDLEVQQAEIDEILAALSAAYDELDHSAGVLAGNIAAQDTAISAAEAEVQANEIAFEETNEALEQAQKEMAALARQAASQGSAQGDGSQYVGGVFVWPVPSSYNISCYFGASDPNGTPHRGMDIHTSGVWGPPIVACGNGLVIIASYAGGSYGNYVVIDHGNGVKTLYAHCERLLVSVGQNVSAGQQIATVGSTGFSTGPHLHLEVQTGSGLVDPLKYLRG